MFVSLTLKTDPIRVLFVEDDENYREIVGDELSYHGFTVHSFADGDALLGSLDAGADADVIVLDWALPTISGIDLLPELRRASRAIRAHRQDSGRSTNYRPLSSNRHWLGD